MIRSLFSLLSPRTVQNLTSQCARNELHPSLMKLATASFSSFKHINEIKMPLTNIVDSNLLQSQVVSHQQVRRVCKFSWKSGKRKTVKAVINRFYRLNCGNWIRTIAGKDKKHWKKSAKLRCKLKQHVFINATQCTLLDKMVSRYWRRPKYYINSPYEPYEWREGFYNTRTKPWRPDDCDYE